MASELPSGSVTFLLTDIEGSTRLFRRLGDRYPPVLEQHNRVLRSALTDHGGVEFKSEGDALLVAFDSAADALAAAVDAQTRIATEPWPPDARIRVRMGLHTGIAYPHDGDYIALALHQAARVVGTGSGGQVVASAEAVAAAGTVDGIEVRRLGAYRLRDFDGPAELHQISAVDAAERAFPALRAIPADGHNVSRPLDAFVGRSTELDELGGLVAPGQLVTLVGPGGMGKTRLAVEFALDVAPSWNDGVWMIDLAALSAGESVGPAVADVLGVAVGDDDPVDAVVEQLRARRALLVLDNCEHVLSSARELTRAVLTACDEVGVLATTRERLAVAGEYAVVVSSLPLKEASVDLFLDRAQRRGAVLPLERDDLEVIVEICQRLDGMPLAIELAAACATVLAPREILAGLRDRLGSLRRRDDVVSERQRTLRGLLDWSYGLLASDEQTVLRRLSVFVGSFDLLTAAAATGHGVIEADDVAEIIWSLVDKSLVNVEQREGSTRYRLLETVRAVAASYGESAGDAPATCDALGVHYLAAFPFESRGNLQWRTRLAIEHGTILPLVDRLVVDGQLDVAYALARLAIEGGLGGAHSRDAALYLADLVDGTKPDGVGLARLHVTMGKMLAEQGDLAGAEHHVNDARRLIAEFGDQDRLGLVVATRAVSQLCLRDGSEQALTLAERELRSQLEHRLPPAMRADSLIELSMVSHALGQQDPDQFLREAAVIAEHEDDHYVRMTVLNNLAEHELRAGETGLAAAHQREAMRLSAELGVQLITAFGLVIAARIAEPEGLDALAVRIHSAAEVLLDECGFEMIPADQLLSDAALEAARVNLGAQFETQVVGGRGLALADVLLEAEEVFDRAIEAATLDERSLDVRA